MAFPPKSLRRLRPRDRQVYLNYLRKSTEGMNIHNFLLDFTGGTLSVAQLCMDARSVRSVRLCVAALPPPPARSSRRAGAG